jgi:hypothetical protein
MSSAGYGGTTACWQQLLCYAGKVLATKQHAIWQPSAAAGPAPADNECEGSNIMKNPLDSLGQTILLGFVLTVIVAVLIPIFGA